MGRRFDVVDAPVDAGVVLEKLETLGTLLLLLSRCSCCCCLGAVVGRSTRIEAVDTVVDLNTKHKAFDAVVVKNARNTTVGGVVGELQQPVASRGLSTGARSG